MAPDRPQVARTATPVEEPGELMFGTPLLPLQSLFRRHRSTLVCGAGLLRGRRLVLWQQWLG